MENPAVKRVIALIDMDCFYCQVELRLDPSLKGKPVAVVQYNQWKQGGIIAVNYEARDRGVTRFMRGEEAKEKCPELCLPSVPCVRGKADLTRYRDAGAEVADVFASFSDCVLRASVDEAFIDLTSQVEERIRNGKVNLTIDNLPSTFVIGHSDLKSNDMESRLKGTSDWIKNLRHNADPTNPDYRLAVGALIVEDIRAEVLKKTGFHCSAGIGHNKILAKLVAGLHKPKCQTVIPHENVPELYENLSLRKVRNLGGKFGKQVAQKLSITNMSELYHFSKEQLVQSFGEKNGTWLYDIARGIDYEPVVSRLIPESIGCSKNFPGKTALDSRDTLKHWLTEMATEVVIRLEKDLEENKRRARQLVVSYKQGGSFSSKSCALSSYNCDSIVKEALDALSKNNQAGTSSNTWDPPIKNLGLSATKFISTKSTIATFLKDKTLQNETQKTIIPSKSDNLKDQEPAEETPITVPVKEKTGIEAFLVRRETKAREELAEEKPSQSLFTQDEEIDETEEPVRRADETTEEVEVKIGTSRGTGISKLPANSFFAKILAQRVVEESKTIDSKAEPEQAETCSAALPETSEEDFTETCPDCQQKIHLTVYFEHLDYHTAMKLDRALNGRPAIQTANRSSPAKKNRSPQRKKRKIVRPADQKEITKFFSTVQK